MTLFSLVFLTACGRSAPVVEAMDDDFHHAVVANPSEPHDEGEVQLSAIPAQKSSLTVKIVKKSVTSYQSQRLAQAVSALNHVVKSPQFKDQIHNFTYLGEKQFVQNSGLTNEQIYQVLMGGAEKYPVQGLANGVAELSIMTFYPGRYDDPYAAVAFTSRTDAYIHIYNSYFNTASVSKLAKTLFHEWTHKMGFSHDVELTERRPYTVPYGIGQLIESSVAEYLGE